MAESPPDQPDSVPDQPEPTGRKSRGWRRWLYILIAIPFEERDLITFYGDQYAAYKRRVGGLIPKLGGAGGDAA